MKVIKKKKNYKYDLGSFVDEQGANVGGLAGMAGQLIGGPQGNILSGVGAGVAAGSALGPLGAGIGGAIGLVGGLLGNAKRNREEKALRKAQRLSFNTNYNNKLEATADTNNENPYGNLIFANGGLIPGDPTKPFTTAKGNVITDQDLAKTQQATGIKWPSKEEYGAWLDKFAKPLPAKTNSKVTYPFGKRGETMTQDEWNYSRAKRGYPDVYSDKVQGTDNFITGEIYSNEVRNDVNEYRKLPRMANGGEVSKELINIEEKELQIDPVTGKILRDYTGINPENGKLYKPHSKGQDGQGNFVTAEPGTFIITSKLSKDYKDSIENNDRIHRDTILQNIKNVKDSKDKSKKMAYGSYVTKVTGSIGTRPLMDLGGSSDGKGFNFGGALNTLTNYAPSLLNIGQGLFGKVEQTPNVQAITNPYTKEILSNMPKDVNLNPLVNRINRNQQTQFRQIDNTTNGNPIARANKNNVFANTQNNLGDVYMQQNQMNNQIAGQRASIYGNLGAQDMQEQARAQQINLGINESNVANRAAKSNLLSTGLSQLQQVYQNQRLNKSKQSMDKYRIDLLRQMFPNLKYYGDQFGEDAINQLIGQ